MKKELKKFYPDSFLESVNLLDRQKYQGKGRPRKSDYMTIREAQIRLNNYFNNMIDENHKILKLRMKYYDESL